METEIINRVAESALITIDLEQYYPKEEFVVLDIAPQLYEGLILREKEFRNFIKTHLWDVYQNKYVAITCFADAIVPTWAYMLVVMALKPYAKYVVYGHLETLKTMVWEHILSNIDYSAYTDKKIVIKGCSHKEVPISAYVYFVQKVLPYAQSIMYGEPCSTVPLYKKPKN